MSAPIIPWLGGKRRLADRLIPLFPSHECYVEVFAGGAALYFLRPSPAPVEIINDLNGELVNLYRVVQHHLVEFCRQFQWALTSRQIFQWLRDADPPGLTDIQRAARFYYIRQCAFGGRIEGPSFGTATTSPAVNFCRIEEALSAAHMRLAGTTIENLPWEECIERYDRPHTFFYIDPPYWQTEGYGIPFPFGEYERLAARMRSMRGRAMLSINDHPDIRRVFFGLRTLELEIRYSISGAGERPPSGELVVTNYEAAGGLFA